MTHKSQLNDDMIALYQRAGEAVGYWGRRYLQAVRRKGGLATAKDMLKPRSQGQRQGLDRLLEANRPDLTLEYLVLRRRYRSLFTSAEIRVARERLGLLRKAMSRARRDRLFPDELEPGRTYPEGAKRQVRVNAYERDSGARKACIRHHGTASTVCSMKLEALYGRLGLGFTHVHHVRPVSKLGNNYRIDPIIDLVPVCPNCHAMLHRKDPPLSVLQLRAVVDSNRSRRNGGTATRSPQRRADSARSPRVRFGRA